MSEQKKEVKIIVAYESFASSIKRDLSSMITLGASCAFAYWVEAGYLLQTAILGMWVIGAVLKVRRIYMDDLNLCYTREEAQSAIDAVDWEQSQ